MIKTKKLIYEIEKLFPLNNSEIWDKTGFNFFHLTKKQIKKIFICLDLSFKAFEKIKICKPDLVIVHHPFFFEETWEKEYKNSPYKKIIKKYFENNDILLYALHTNYDNSKFGTSYQITKKLNYSKNIQTHSNYVSLVKVKDNLPKIIANIKKTFNFEFILSNIDLIKYNPEKKEYKLAFFAGAGDLSLINEIKKKYNFDIAITSDLKWNSLITLEAENILYFNVPHRIEEVFVENIKSILNNLNSNLEIIVFYSNIKLKTLT